MSRSVVPFPVLSRRSLAYSPAAPTVSPHVSVICGLFNSLCALFTTRAVYFQQLADSFCKTPGVGVPMRNPALESASSRSLFSSLRVGSAPSVSWHYHLLSILPALCLHNDTDCFSRKPFSLITIRIARGRGVYPGVVVLGLASGGRRSRRKLADETELLASVRAAGLVTSCAPMTGATLARTWRVAVQKTRLVTTGGVAQPAW